MSIEHIHLNTPPFGPAAGMTADHGSSRIVSAEKLTRDCCRERQSAQPSAQPSSAARTALPVLPREGHRTALLVDDEPAIRSLVEAVLITLGYRVLACSDGDEALRCAALYSDELDLLVTDLVMPRVGGLELAQKMLADRPEMPILLISGFSHDKRAIEELLASRSDIGFLRKPFKLSELERTLRALGGPASSPPTSQA